jgi:hypothetical protein
MGQTCGGCGCNEDKQEFAIKHEVTAKHNSKDLQYYLPHIKIIIKMQALWRGYSARQKVALITETRKADSRYFT